MGCTQSKIENEEAVSRCRERKQFMKDAVAARNAFAAAHCAYAMALKNTGAALSDYAQGEVQNPHSVPPSSSAAVAALPGQAPLESLPPPPPPIPADIAPTPPPLQRATSMPEFAVSKPSIHPSEPIIEEEDEDEIENEGAGLRRRSSNRSGRGGGGDGGGRSVGGGMRVRLEEDGPPPPPSPPPEAPPPINGAPPPPPKAENSTWDFFFGVENMSGGSLGDVEDTRREREEIERKMLEQERAKRSRKMVSGGGDAGGGAGGEGSSRNRKVEDVAVMEAEKVVEKPPLPPQQAVGAGKTVQRSKQVAGVGTGGEGKRAVGKYVNLLQIFNDLDDCFLKASESAHEVSKMLEAARLHYHSNFADNRGHIDHSARVMRVITWNRSFRGLPSVDDGKDDFDSEENETHATVLDKLLAWEKKLYDEVKAGEVMKFEYHRKIALLNKQKKRGTNPEALEKTKAAVSHLHTRYIVDMQSLDSTVSEINRLRDEQLYPKLVALVDAMATMWEAMHLHHRDQLNIALQLKGIDISQSTKETSEHHHQRTIQLWLVFQEWCTQFEKMMIHQKEYIRALNSWLKLNLVPIESSLKEKVSSPPRAQSPAIQALLFTWHAFLEKLPDELARSAIYSFEAILHTLVQQQEDELKMKARCEESRKDLAHKKRQFDDWYNKYTQRRTPPDEMDPDRPEDSVHRDIVAEKHFVVETAKKKLEEDEEAYSKQCVHVRDKSLVSLKTRMPELLHVMADFAQDCSRMYRDLSATRQARKQMDISSQ